MNQYQLMQATRTYGAAMLAYAERDAATVGARYETRRAIIATVTTASRRADANARLAAVLARLDAAAS